jgi:hypothetical protein
MSDLVRRIHECTGACIVSRIAPYTMLPKAATA